MEPPHHTLQDQPAPLITGAPAQVCVSFPPTHTHPCAHPFRASVTCSDLTLATCHGHSHLPSEDQGWQLSLLNPSLDQRSAEEMLLPSG